MSKLKILKALTIKELNPTERTFHCLRRAGIETVGELIQFSWNDLASMRNVVRKTIEEIVRLLKGIGLKLREEK